VIVEAPASSGALYTAQFALEQGRDLWVSSAGITSPSGEGTKKLADEGCPVLLNAAQIAAEWGLSGDTGTKARPGIFIQAGGRDLASALKHELQLN
jgi:DNA processing protein